MRRAKIIIAVLIYVLFMGVKLVSADVYEHVVGLWLFDESSGQVAHDSSKNGNDAEFFGKPKWVDGKFGKALWFNGSDDYIAASDSDSLDINGDQLSIVAWIKGEGWPAANHVVRKIADEAQGHIYVLRIQPNTVRVYLNTNAGEEMINGGTALPTNEWMHIAMVYDGHEVRIYVNGELDGSAPMTEEVTQSDNELRIGRGDPAGYFLGTIDEVAIFASALSEENILEVMEIGLKELTLSVEPAGKLPIAWAGVKTAY